MRKINTNIVKDVVKDLAIKASTEVDPDLKKRLEVARDTEISELSKNVLDSMISNFDIASEKSLPICQDTGMAILFLEIGQDVFLEGEYLEDMINQGIREAYEEAYLRKSVVGDPLRRVNTKDNTPAIIHTKIVPGDKVNITLVAKGFGSENTSSLKMLKPADGIEGVKTYIDEVIKNAIPNGCAPLVVGVGIGGDFESSALLAKKALTEPINSKNSDELYRQLEEDILKTANNTGIGPMGVGGMNSVLAVHILKEPTHIAGLPVAVNVCCYVDRVKKAEI